MKKKIDFSDLKRAPEGYMKYEDKDVEIALEPCLSGCDIAVYKNKELLEPKICTDVLEPNELMGILEVRDKALKSMNKFYSKYFITDSGRKGDI